MRQRRRSRRRPTDQRGAAAVLIGIVMSLLLVTIAAFAVDLGLQRTARRDMQALADVVALDLARQLDGRTRGALSGVMDEEMAKSLNRNADTVGAAPDLDWDLGRIVDGAFVAVDEGGVPTAVEVRAATSVEFGFGRVTGIASGDAARTAVAQSEGGACFTIGSYAARLDTGASPILGPLLGVLGSNVTLSAVDYNGLANTRVGLLDLLGVSLGAGTLEDLVAGGDLVSLGDFYLATAGVLSKQGNAVQAALLQAIAVGLQDVSLQVSDIIGLGTGGSTGLDAGVNVLDLVTAAASAATGQNALTVPQVGVNLGPLANVGVNLTAIEAPRMGCGRKNAASAESAQVRVNLSANALKLNIVLAATDVALSGNVQVAKARGNLTDVRCAPEGISVQVSDGLLNVDLRLEVKVYALGLIPVISGPITIKGQTGTGGTAVKNIGSDADYEIPATVGSGTGGLPVLTVDTSDVKLIGLPVGIALNSVVSGLLSGLVNPLIQALDTALLSPLLNALGLDLSGADVYALRTPKCDSPKLVG